MQRYIVLLFFHIIFAQLPVDLLPNEISIPLEYTVNVDTELLLSVIIH